MGSLGRWARTTANIDRRRMTVQGSARVNFMLQIVRGLIQEWRWKMVLEGCRWRTDTGMEMEDGFILG